MWARIENGIVMELINFNPEGCFTDEIVAQFVQVPSSLQVQQGWLYSNGTFSAPIITLVQSQQNKISQIQQAYQATLMAGFSSSATATPYTYNYGQLDQMKFIKLAIDVANNNITFPVPIPSSTGIIVMHTLAQYQQLAKDISNFEWGLQNKLHNLLLKVQNATSINSLTPIDFNDVTPPAVPSGLKYTSGVLSWTANTEADLYGYDIYQSSDNKVFTKINTSIVTTNSYTVTGLTTFSTYYFVISAVDVNTNESAQCASITVTA